jgi:acyl carrier protein
MSHQEATLGKLRVWLARKNPAIDVATITDDTDIIESRILESLQLVEFILFLEQESGREILREELAPERLRTLGTIYREFFSSEGPNDNHDG